MNAFPHNLQLASRLAAVAGLLCITGFAGAQEDAPDLYEVELIVFRHTDQGRNTPEIPAAPSLFNPSPLDLSLPDIPLADTDDAIDANAPLIREPAPAVVAPAPDTEFLLLEPDPEFPDFVPLLDTNFMLDSVYRRLERIDAYEPLLHVGWIQPARPSAESVPYRLNPETPEGSAVTGTITLFKKRFLHLDIDLALESDRRPASTLLFSRWNDDDENLHTLKESRRIRGTDVQYFDHPQFGLIARIREVKAARAEREKTG